MRRPLLTLLGAGMAHAQVDERAMKAAYLYNFILTIADGADGDGLAEKGMMIEIQKRDLKLGFEVDLAMARKVRIDFSPRMLEMATFVSGAR